MREQRIQRLSLTIGSLLGYFVFGLFDSLKGSTMSSLLDEMNISYAQSGTIVMGQYAGFFCATFAAGKLVEHYGQKITLVVAGLCMILGLTGYSFSTAMPGSLLFIFFIGMGLGSLELVGCNIITVYYPQESGRYLNILTAVAGIGAIISPLISGGLLSLNISWRSIYRGCLLVAIPTTFYFLIMKDPAVKNQLTKRPPKRVKASASSVRLCQRDLLLMYLANFSYMAMEMGIATWIANFYQSEKHWSVAAGARFLSFFYIGMTFGRVIGSFFVDKWGRQKSVLTASLCSALLIILGVFGPVYLSWCTAFSGFFCSIIFPTGTAILSGLPEGTAVRVQGIYFACGGLGGMFGPWLMGIVSDLLGIKWGMALGAFFSIGILLSIGLLPTENRRRQIP